MNGIHLLAIVCGLGWLILVAFATGSFLLSVPPGLLILFGGWAMAEMRIEGERRALYRVRVYNNAVIRAAHEEGREPEDSDLLPEPRYRPGSWLLFLVGMILGVILLAIAAYTPDQTIEDIRDQSPYVEEPRGRRR